ncbi:hypothetical protein EGW08_005735 [Elysia chlorotica]|uniref:PX domain-containing protein n=1 Tax=Elysia chlorotica TaxID=188477 RepID=A0A3S1BLJ7_ELYCH|nr:hypothetical protein EGW08_005735 [Elysia chlorotica]
MPRATVASRELKNKDTGMDLFVPTFKEIKGRLSSTVYYQVVVVTNLPFFKTPSHKETDVVQLSIEKKWVDFEEMRTKLSEAFPGTMLPLIDKKSFIVNDFVLKERRNSLDLFVKFLAMVSKLAKSPAVLQFLGVDAIRANKTKLDDVPGDKKSAQTTDTDKESKPDADVDVFGETQDSQDAGDLFDEDGEGTDDLAAFGDNTGEVERSRGSFSMFEAQDMKADIDEEDEKEFGFVPDAIITKRENIFVDTGEEDDEEAKEKEELFRIEDDLDNLLVVDIEKPSRTVDPAKEPSTPPAPAMKPKPKPAAKPSLPSKPKPGASSSAKPAVPPKKPAAVQKQEKAAADSTSTADSSHPASAAAAVDVMQQDDLLAYLQEELTSNAEDVDLFS